MARREPAPLTAYRSVLGTRDELSQPFVIVGGQAVNFRAERYVGHAPRLATFEPFTSKDLDPLVTRDRVPRLTAEVASHGWTYVAPDPDAEAVLGRLEQDDLLVELLDPGPRPVFPAVGTNLLLSRNAHVSIRVSHPLLLVDSKIDLALRIPQDGSLAGIEVRRDAEHVRMLSLLIPHFLAEQVQRSKIPAEKAAILQPMVAVLSSIRRSSGDKFDALYPGVIEWHDLVPPALRDLPLDDVHRRVLEELLFQDAAKFPREPLI